MYPSCNYRRLIALIPIRDVPVREVDKAYGYYPDAGQTLIFKPDSTGTPRLIANLSYEQFMALK